MRTDFYLGPFYPIQHLLNVCGENLGSLTGRNYPKVPLVISQQINGQIGIFIPWTTTQQQRGTNWMTAEK